MGETAGKTDGNKHYKTHIWNLRVIQVNDNTLHIVQYEFDVLAILSFTCISIGVFFLVIHGVTFTNWLSFLFISVGIAIICKFPYKTTFVIDKKNNVMYTNENTLFSSEQEIMEFTYMKAVIEKSYSKSVEPYVTTSSIDIVELHTDSSTIRIQPVQGTKSCTYIANIINNFLNP